RDGCHRVRRPEDGPADDEEVGARTDGLGRGGGSDLVAGDGARGSDAGSDDEELGAVAALERFRLEGRGDDPVQLVRGGDGGQTRDLLAHRAQLLVPNLFDVPGGEGREQCDAEEAWTVSTDGFPRGAEHGAPAGGV